MIKLIASDMDGTLLNSKHELSKENLEAIKKAQEMGIHFAISTGRMYSDVEPFLKEHGIECECVLMNGAEYRDKDGTLLESRYIDTSRATEILDIIKNNELSAEIDTDKGIYTIETKEKALIQVAYRIQTFNPGTSFEEAIIMAEEHKHFIDLNYIASIEELSNSDIRIGKFIIFHDSEDKIVKLKYQLKTIDALAISSSFTTNVEVNHIEAQKGTILAKVAEKIGMKKDEVVVIGDSFNDCSMFTEFPISFAMENAIPEIKEMTKYVTDTNDNAGVAKVIYKVLNNDF